MFHLPNPQTARDASDGSFLRNEAGATAIEYGLIAGLLSVGVLASTLAFGGGLQALWNDVTGRLVDAMTF